MEKGKFGFSVALYPLLILLCILFNQTWVALAIFLFVLFTEQSAQAHKQSMQAALFAFVYPVYAFLTGQLSHFFFNYLPWQMSRFSEYNMLSEGVRNFFDTTGTVFRVLGSVIFFGYVCYVLVCGVMPLAKGNEMKLPLKGLVNRLYGFVPQRTQTQYGPAPAQQYAQPQQTYAPPAQTYAQPRSIFCTKCGSSYPEGQTCPNGCK